MSARSADVALHPHQLEPLAAILAGARRVLLADEVGLGKTIQAGLVLAELHARLPAMRALVLVPAALRQQWTDELTSRFGLPVSAADREMFDRDRRTAWRGDSPWLRAGATIASLDFLKQRHVQDALPRAPWDVAIVDEAHDACGDSERHAGCAAILQRARRVLLLTATPHSGDEARYARLMALGALPGLADPLVVFRRTRADLAWPSQRRVRWTAVAPSPPEAAVLEVLLQFERRVLDRERTRPGSALLLLSVFRKRALSTMTALDRSLVRRQDWLRQASGQATDAWTQPRLAFDDEADGFGEDERAGLSAAIDLPPDQERAWLGRLQTLARAAVGSDSKVAHVVRLAARTREPIVVFTEFRDSVMWLRSRLAAVRSVAVLHGGQSPAERSRELAAFLDGRASILAATDVAGQGLNLQRRARWVVSLELPWNPARLAQRIGRVDRIGQRRAVHATLLVARHPAESGVLARLSRRALAARQTFGRHALEDVAPPDPLTVASSVLTDTQEPEREPPAATRVDAARDGLGRRGRAVARVLARKRRLAALWRSPFPDFGPAITAVRRHPAWPRSAAAIAIFSAPLTNGAGEIVEPGYLALGLPSADETWLAHPRVLEAIAVLAESRFRSRCARLARSLSGAHEGAARVDRAIESLVRSAEASRLRQPGLFFNRGPFPSEQATPAGAPIGDGTTARSGHDVDVSSVAPGPPRLVLLIRLRQ